MTTWLQSASDFGDWMHKVDINVQRLAGLSVYDLDDCCYADWHADGMSPASAARKAIRHAKGSDE